MAAVSTSSSTSSLTLPLIVPDLTFSEITFLNSRRPGADSATKQAPEKKRRRRDKMIDTETEMSRYFTAKRPEKKENNIDQEHKRTEASAVHAPARGRGDVDRSTSVSSLPPVDLPDRPFLGFGSSGATLTSPVRFAIHRDVPNRRSIRSESGSSRRSSISSSSDYSWSISAPSRKEDHHSRMDTNPAEISHDRHETPQAQTPGVQRPESIPKKQLCVKPQDATGRGAGGKQQIVAEEKSRSRPASAGINPRIEPQEEDLPREMMRGPRENIMQGTCPKDSTQMCTQTAVMEKNGRSKVEQDNEHHVHRNILEPRQSNGTRFPSSFDRALEDLLQTCNVSLNRSKDPVATSNGNEPLNQTQSHGSPLGISARGQDTSVTDQTKRFNSDKTYPDGQAFKSVCPQSSKLETSVPNVKVNSNFSQPENARNPPSKPTPEVSKILTHSPNRTWPGHEPTASHSSLGWHQYEQQHDHTSVRATQGSISSGAWHGYQTLYGNQVIPDHEVDVDVDERYALDTEHQDGQDEQEWFQHHAADADGAESGFPFEGTQIDLLYAQQGPKDSYTGAHDWESTHLPYDKFDERRPVVNNNIDLDVKHPIIYRFSDSGYGRSTITPGESPCSPISVFSRPEDNATTEVRIMDTTSAPNVYGQRISHRWRPAQIDDNETYLADFWRPNRLY